MTLRNESRGAVPGAPSAAATRPAGSRKRRPAARASAAHPDKPPFVGALLRLAWQRVRAHIHAAVRAAGFDDLDDAHLLLFRYPPPDGVRPSALARDCGISRQAANYLIAQLEERGYLERRAAADGTRRLVYLTRRGWALVEVLKVDLRGLHAQWSAELGARRFATFLDVLRALAGVSTPATAAPRKRSSARRASRG